MLSWKLLYNAVVFNLFIEKINELRVKGQKPNFE